ncbi:MAG: LysM peptidoglycan-binding domain-containing protein [Streptococcaceae bacterium]|jgi:LysM repeat protein|nr:LysM peptidoglycan-binding domain-containing protein [Streptococcaceae bacterium]
MKKLTILGALLLALFLTKNVSAEQVEVRSGDTLSELAEKYGVSVDDLVRINQIKDRSLIYVGDILETGNQTEAQAVQTKQPAATAASVSTNSYIATTNSAKEWIAQVESGGSYTATNGRYIGRYQLTNSYLNGDYSIENQERVADRYVASRYGSWENAKQFWLNNGWY